MAVGAVEVPGAGEVVVGEVAVAGVTTTVGTIMGAGVTEVTALLPSSGDWAE